MKINMLQLVPKGWDIVDKGEAIIVTYRASKGKGPKPITFPKHIEVDEKLMEGIGLYLGDGDLNRKEKKINLLIF